MAEAKWTVVHKAIISFALTIFAMGYFMIVDFILGDRTVQTSNSSNTHEKY